MTFAHRSGYGSGIASTMHTIKGYQENIIAGVSASYVYINEFYGAAGIRIKMSEDKFKGIKTNVESVLGAFVQRLETFEKPQYAHGSVSYNESIGYAEVSIQSFNSKLEKEVVAELLKVVKPLGL